MRKRILYLAVLLFPCFAMAQVENLEVLRKMQEYGFDKEWLVDNLNEETASYAFRVKSTTMTPKETQIQEIAFDPSREQGEKWELLSVNGNPPTKKQVKRFNKERNKEREKPDIRIDQLTVERDEPVYFDVGFTLLRATLPKKLEFLADCKGVAEFNKHTKELERIRFFNVKEELKFSVLKVSDVMLVVELMEDSKTGEMFREREDLKLKAKVLGKEGIVKVTNEYYDFEKVK